MNHTALPEWTNETAPDGLLCPQTAPVDTSSADGQAVMDVCVSGARTLMEPQNAPLALAVC